MSRAAPASRLRAARLRHPPPTRMPGTRLPSAPRLETASRSDAATEYWLLRNRRRTAATESRCPSTLARAGASWPRRWLPATVTATQAPTSSAAGRLPRRSPGLDAQVDNFMERADEGGTTAAGVLRSRPTTCAPWVTPTSARAAETSNRLTSAGQGRSGGRYRRGGPPSAETTRAAVARWRNSTPVPGDRGRKILRIIPFGDKVVDYFSATSPRRPAQRHPPCPAQQPGQADPRQRRPQPQTNLWATMGRLNQYVYIAERLDPAAKIAEMATQLSRRGQGTQAGRPLLRPPEAPGPADPLAVSIRVIWRSTSSSEQHQTIGASTVPPRHLVSRVADRRHRRPGPESRNSSSSRSPRSTRRRVG